METETEPAIAASDGAVDTMTGIEDDGSITPLSAMNVSFLVGCSSALPPSLGLSLGPSELSPPKQNQYGGLHVEVQQAV